MQVYMQDYIRRQQMYANVCTSFGRQCKMCNRNCKTIKELLTIILRLMMFSLR